MRSEQDPARTAKASGDLIRENIDYDSLIVSHSMDQQLIDGAPGGKIHVLGTGLYHEADQAGNPGIDWDPAE